MVLTFSEMQLSFGHGCMKGMLLEWAHDVHLDPSSELFFWRVFWTRPGPLVLSSIRLRLDVSGCECRWFGHWPNCEQIKVFKTGNVFLAVLALSYLLECYSMELEWSLIGL